MGLLLCGGISVILVLDFAVHHNALSSASPTPPAARRAVAPAAARPKALTPIERIDADCATLDTALQHEGSPVHLASVADTAMDEASPEPWQVYASDADAQKALAEQHNLYAGANVLVQENQVRFAAAKFRSGGEDWQMQAQYCFDPDGQVEKIQSQLNTSAGNVSVLRTWYYNSNGARILEKVEYRTLDGGKLLDAAPENFQDVATPVYLNVAASPFRAALGSG